MRSVLNYIAISCEDLSLLLWWHLRGSWQSGGFKRWLQCTRASAGYHEVLA